MLRGQQALRLRQEHDVVARSVRDAPAGGAHHRVGALACGVIEHPEAAVRIDARDPRARKMTFRLHEQAEGEL
jgi:hypothetical protein